MNSRLPKSGLVAAAVAALLPLHLSAQRCEYERELTGGEATSASEVLLITAGAGELRVEGRAGLNQVQVRALVCVSHEEMLDEVGFSLESNSRGVFIETERPEWDRRDWGRNHYARVDFEIEVPLGMALDITDGSGNITLFDVGAVDLQDGSGHLEIRGARGNVRVKDGSGNLLIEDVAGDVEVVDGSGWVEIENIEGSFDITDGSGKIEIREVSENVTVHRDGSGTIDVNGVGGDLEVNKRGSGSVRHSNVDGRVDVPERNRRRGRRGRSLF